LLSREIITKPENCPLLIYFELDLSWLRIELEMCRYFVRMTLQHLNIGALNKIKLRAPQSNCTFPDYKTLTLKVLTLPGNWTGGRERVF
jgi:hypothetical protein